MENVQPEPELGRDTRLIVYCGTAAKACRVVELMTTMNHGVKDLDREVEDHYAVVNVYTGGQKKSEQVARHLDMLGS